MRKNYSRGIAICERLLRDPSLLPVVWNKVQARFTDKSHRKRIGTYAGLVTPPTETVAQILGLDPLLIHSSMEAKPLCRLLAKLQAYEVPRQGSDAGGAAFLEAYYSIVSLTKPKVVLETGVAHGYSTTVILQALEDNGAGKLYSVDLPMFRAGFSSHPGGAIPEPLKSSPRWELTLGPDRRVLPSLLKRIGAIDLFFYDSDKSYEGMMRTWNLVWPYLRSGAVLVLDDVHLHDTFLDFAATQGLTPLVVSKPALNQGVSRGLRANYVGLLRKPAD